MPKCNCHASVTLIGNILSLVIILRRGVRSGSLNISTRDDKREQVSTILVNISVNEAVVFTNIFQLLVVLVLLGRILDADWSENDVRIGWSSVYCTMGSH